MNVNSNKKIPLITSDRVYYKIKWHEKADQKKAFITFLNYGELKVIPYHDWVPIEKGGEIPWHRVYQIKYSGKVLWDRNTREFNQDILEDTSYFSNIKLLRFNSKKWLTLENNSFDVIPDKIKIISLNCLIDKYDKNITNLIPRLPVILKYLEEYNADIICLQEITIKFKNYLMDNTFIKNNYYITSNEPKIFGQLILSKYKPISQNLITFEGNHMKKYLHMSFKNRLDEIIEIYNIHLTSNQQLNSNQKRDGQLKQLFGELSDNKIIIAGDFNNDDKMEYGELKDTWEVLRSQEDGFTFDYIENGLTSKTTKSFIRTRIDKILFSNLLPVDIQLAFKKSINKVWASDHFGLLSEFDVISDSNQIDTPVNNDIIVRPGTILCLVLKPKYWSFLNKFRSKYDDGYTKIAPHVTLIQKFVSVDEWPLVKDTIKEINDSVVFDTVEIFELTNKYAVVLVTSDNEKVNMIRNNLTEKLNLNITSNPHITLAIVDNEKKANTIKNQVELLLLNYEKIVVNLDIITFMKKMGDQYQVYDSIGVNTEINPLDLIKEISLNLIENFNYKIIGSRAYGINDSDYDIVLFGNIGQEEFGNKFVSFAKMTPQFIYAKYVMSKVPTINLITCNYDEINLIYQENNNINQYVLNSINSVIEVDKLINSRKELFTECYRLVRIWAKRRNIYGSKYGYFNGITWLILTLNVFLKISIKNKKEFIMKFFKFYNEYDWNIPVNINNLSVERTTKSDELVYICNVIDKDKLIRTLTPTTWNIILQEFKRTKENMDLNIIFEKKKIPLNFVKITINDSFIFNRFEKQNQLISEMWKLTLKSNGIYPYIEWINKNNQLTYKFGISASSDFEIINNYFRKYLCLVEFVNK